jgi:hypothetical protein
MGLSVRGAQTAPPQWGLVPLVCQYDAICIDGAVVLVVTMSLLGTVPPTPVHGRLLWRRPESP